MPPSNPDDWKIVNVLKFCHLLPQSVLISGPRSSFPSLSSSISPSLPLSLSLSLFFPLALCLTLAFSFSLSLSQPIRVQIDNQDEYRASVNFPSYYYKWEAEINRLQEWSPELLLNHLTALESLKRVCCDLCPILMNALSDLHSSGQVTLLVLTSGIVRDLFPFFS